MSTQPNTLLLLVLTPDGLTTLHDILTDYSLGEEDDDEIIIGGERYSWLVTESDYDEDMQISAPEGSIVFRGFVTYGYGEYVEWDKLQAQKETLEEWAKSVCSQYHCSYSIRVSANYW